MEVLVQDDSVERSWTHLLPQMHWICATNGTTSFEEHKVNKVLSTSCISGEWEGKYFKVARRGHQTPPSPWGAKYLNFTLSTPAFRLLPERTSKHLVLKVNKDCIHERQRAEWIEESSFKGSQTQRPWSPALRQPTEMLSDFLWKRFFASSIEMRGRPLIHTHLRTYWKRSGDRVWQTSFLQSSSLESCTESS